MNLTMIKKGISNPTEVPKYLYRRVRDYRAGDRITFDQKTVVGSKEHPDFAKELYLDVSLLKDGLEDFHAGKSLEIGCGFGRLTPWIARFSDSHYAVEPEEGLIADAKRLYPEVTYSNTIAQELPFDDSTFDLVVTWAVLMHVPPQQIESVANEIERVATDDAVLVVSEKVGEDESVSRVFSREVSNYEALFPSFDLVKEVEREMEQFRDTDHHHSLMRFERSPEV